MLAEECCIGNEVLASDARRSQGGHHSARDVEFAQLRYSDPNQRCPKQHTALDTLLQLTMNGLELRRSPSQKVTLVRVVNKDDSSLQPVHLDVPAQNLGGRHRLSIV
jgi:hypothetical protein